MTTGCTTWEAIAFTPGEKHSDQTKSQVTQCIQGNNAKRAEAQIKAINEVLGPKTQEGVRKPVAGGD